MTTIEVFGWGLFGSITMELVTLVQAHNIDAKRLPPRYHQLPFWIIRGLLALVAGGMAVAYDIQTPLLAINVGAATPLILTALAHGERSPILSVPEKTEEPKAPGST